MALTVTMPQLGESVTEGTIARWLKQPGELVAKYDSIAEVVTDKVNAEIPAPADGSMGEHIVKEGDVVAVGQPICTIETTEQAQQRSAWAQPTLEEGDAAAHGNGSANGHGNAIEPAPEQAPVEAAPATAEQSQPATAAAELPPAVAAVPQRAAPELDTTGYHLTPAVRALVRQHGVDLAGLSGSGIGGRITKKDVLDYVERGPSQPATASVPAQTLVRPSAGAAVASGAAPVIQPARESQPLPEGGDRLVPLTPMRRAIAEHMVRSKHTSPHAWLTVEVDMTAVARLRTQRKEEFQRRFGISLTFLPFVARATCEALAEYPMVNSVWTDDGIVEKRDVHLGIAVALEDNLIVPVVRNADRLTVSGLAQTMSELAERARSNRLKLEEIQGGTFTLNNTGALGTVLTQPIINQPQAGILAMDSVIKRAVVVEGDAIAVRSIMNLCMSFDHRIVDGLQAARFIRAIKQRLEAIDADTML